MTESVSAIPTTAPAPAQAQPGNNVAPADSADAPANGQFQSALLQQLQGRGAVGAETLSAVPSPVPELLQQLAGDAKPATEKSDQDGTALPLPGQILPLDPTLLAVAPPQAQALPTGSELAAALLVTVNAAPGGGMTNPLPRLNPTPVAKAVAQLGAAPGQATQTLPSLLAALTPQHAVVAAPGSVAVTADLSPQLPVPSVTAALPVALTNALAASTASAAPPNLAAPASAVPAIAIPVAQPGWDQALGQRVQWLVGQQLQGAELRITPAHLGPIEVRISIGQDQQTVVNFASPHAAVRDAIEAAVPRLRDMLGNNGQDLVNVNVSQHSFAEQRRQAASSGNGRDNAYPGALSAGTVEAVAGAAVPVRSGSGLVDYFA